MPLPDPADDAIRIGAHGLIDRFPSASLPVALEASPPRPRDRSAPRRDAAGLFLERRKPCAPWPESHGFCNRRTRFPLNANTFPTPPRRLVRAFRKLSVLRQHSPPSTTLPAQPALTHIHRLLSTLRWHAPAQHCPMCDATQKRVRHPHPSPDSSPTTTPRNTPGHGPVMEAQRQLNAHRRRRKGRPTHN